MPATKLTPVEDADCLELIRVSTPDQATADKGGIDAQYAACKKIAAQYAITARWNIRIDGVSGAAVRRSPGFKQLRLVVKSGACRGLIMKDSSRLLRPDNFEDYEILELLRTHKVRLYTESGVTDLDSNQDRFMATVMLGVSGLERGVIRERTMGGKKAKRSRGEFVAGKASIPFGLTIEQVGKARRYGVDPIKIKQVIRLFALFTGGQTSFRELAASTGIPYDSIKNILTNEIYTGERVITETVDPSKNEYRADGTLKFQRRVKLPKEEQERIPVLDTPPPVSKAVFQLAQKMLELKTRQGPAAASQIDDDLYYRGCLVCGSCGRQMFALSWTDNREGRGHQYQFYVCAGKKGVRGKWNAATKKFDCAIPAGTCDTKQVPIRLLHPLLDQFMKERLGSRAFLHKAIKQRMAGDQNGPDKKKSLAAEILQVKKRRDTLLDLYLGDLDKPEGNRKVSKEVFESKSESFAAQLVELNRELESVQYDVPVQFDAEFWEPLALDFAIWDLLSTTEKRVALAKIMPCFAVTGRPGKKRGDTVVSVAKVTLSIGDIEFAS
jgi:DNA invertase Pin-like site-specific DNA recombinase